MPSEIGDVGVRSGPPDAEEPAGRSPDRDGTQPEVGASAPRDDDPVAAAPDETGAPDAEVAADGDAAEAPVDIHADAVEEIVGSGLFDAAFYVAAHPEVATSDLDPIRHFLTIGSEIGYRPNPYFEPSWYISQHADLQTMTLNPLLHYIRHGDGEGRRPTSLFNPAWYRATYALEPEQSALRHYLENRFSYLYNPIPEFDVAYYVGHSPDVQAAKIDAFEHFLNVGYREGRNPSAGLDIHSYAARFLKSSPGQHPFFHYINNPDRDLGPRQRDGEPTTASEIRRFSAKSLAFEERRPLQSTAVAKAKVLAYYLPQFHAMPENDAWWGNGFTEWTNLSRGVPRFVGHYQPRVPRDLGFYSLASTDAMRRQIELALGAGIYGFVFYFYWFSGKRLMEGPIDRFLADRSLAMPFCLMWANESWSRRWDGSEEQVLIAQQYSADEDEELVAAFARHFQDPRYIRVGGRPLLMVYRMDIVPDGAQAVTRWRRLFRARGEDPIFVMAQAFGHNDPRDFGLDAAIEFPPHKLTQNMASVNHEMQWLDEDATSRVLRYDDIVEVSLKEEPAAYPLIKTVFPGWDNDARRQGLGGMSVIGSTPSKYQAWLSDVIDRARDVPFFDAPIVCVNAWNEWAEGAYLEPDLHYGSAYLNATGRAITGVDDRDVLGKLLLVGHDCFPAGAQHLLVRIGQALRARHGVEVEFLLLSGGAMEDQYRRVAPTTIVVGGTDLAALATAFAERGFRRAIVNTAASAGAVRVLKRAGVQATMLVHELPRILAEKNLTAVARDGARLAEKLVFASPFGRDRFAEATGLPIDGNVTILPQGLYKIVEFDAARGAETRTRLGVADGEHVVLGVGYADMRKGFDLFIQLWRLLNPIGANRVHCVWVGAVDPDMANWLATEIGMAEDAGSFHMAGHQDDVAAYFSAADAYALTSREDPFPTVVLEALNTGLPTFAFDGSGGIPDLLRTMGEATVVPYADVPAMAAAIRTALTRGNDADHRADRRALIDEKFSFARYVERLVELSLPGLHRVSVIVPNYNYAQYLPLRLTSIFEQTYPVHEIVVLDDASPDASVAAIEDTAASASRVVRLVTSPVNSGSVFAQWRKAAAAAQGEFLWIAEADDAASPDFLAAALDQMASDPSIAFVFTDSRAIDTAGVEVMESYRPYYATVEPAALSKTGVFEARDFVARFLSVKNLVLNVSAVVWRTDAIRRGIERCWDELADYKVAGDWRLYLEVLAEPGACVGYVARPLNVHRRHASSVTQALAARRHVEEIEACHAVARDRFDLADIASRQSLYAAQVAEQLRRDVEEPVAHDA